MSKPQRYGVETWRGKEERGFAVFHGFNSFEVVKPIPQQGFAKREHRPLFNRRVSDAVLSPRLWSSTNRYIGPLRQFHSCGPGLKRTSYRLLQC